MQARDVMTKRVISVQPDTSVRDVARTLVRHKISGAPVVDQAGRLLGVVSEGDLMRRAESETEQHRSWWLRLLLSPEEKAAEYVKTHGRCAADVMSKPVQTVSETTSLEKVADLLQKHRIKRVPVLRRGKVVGIVTRADLLHGLIARQARAKPTVGDSKIKAAVERALDQAGVEAGYLSVVVSGGVVHIWGLVNSKEEKDAVRVAARVPGVKKVQLNVAAMPMSKFLVE
jgi:CBS domain-containing protein